MKKNVMSVREMRNQDFLGLYSIVELNSGDAFNKPEVVIDQGCIFRSTGKKSEYLDVLEEGEVIAKNQPAPKKAKYFFHPETQVCLIYENDKKAD